jgi:ATP-dependent helicase/nuclease subunit B
MKLLIGSANSGKTERVLAHLTEAMTQKRRVWLIVPSLAAAEVLTDHLNASLKRHAVEAPKFAPVTFPYFCQVILRLTGENRTPLSALERARLLRRTIARLAAENALTYFDKIAGKSGLTNSLASFIDDLWRSNIDPQAFAELSENRTDKDRDIALIFERYVQGLDAAGAIDAEGAGVYAVRRLEKFLADNKADSALHKRIADELALVACDGFDFYTPTQIRLLRLLSDCGIETLATLTYESDRAVHLWQKRTRERFDEAGAEIIDLSQPPTTDLGRVAALLMGDDPAVEAAPTSAINIISAPDRQAEVRAVARAIKHLVIEEGFALSGMTIICRALSTYVHHLDRIFDECEIPTALDHQLALAENPCVVALIRLLQLAGTGFPRQALIESLRSPYFDFSAFDLNHQTIDLLDSVSLDDQVMRGRSQWLEALKAPEQLQGDGKQIGNELTNANSRIGLSEKLDQLFQALSFSPSASRKSYVRRIEELITRFQIDKQVTSGTTIAFDKPALQRFLDLLQVIGSDVDSRDLGQAAEGKEIAWEVFLNELQEAVIAATFSRPPAPQASVLVQEAHNLRPRAYRAIFIIGLIEGEFPKKATETSPYTRAERAALREMGFDLAETTNDAGADLTQFYKALTRATDRIYLSFARSDFAGGELLKSYLVDEVKAVARVDELRIAQIETPDPVRMREAASLEELALLTARGLRDGESTVANLHLAEASALLESRLPNWPMTRRAVAVERRRLRGDERGRFGGFIVDEKLAAIIQQRFGEDYLWSASKINDYGLCPFRFFARYVLRLSERREPAENFTPDRLGTAYHDILERTYRALKARRLTLGENSFDEAAAIVEEVSETVLGEMLEKRQVRQSGLWDFEKNEIKKRVTNLLRAEIEWNGEGAATPVAFEQKFGRDGKPPLVINSLSGKIRINGQIDRIDEQDGELTVIDYKTARSPVSARDAENGRNLQLPIYLMAADRVLMRDKPVAGGYYLHITSCKKGSPFPSKNLSLEALTERAEQYITDYVSAVRRAEFPIQPNQNRCPPCEFETLCRIQSLGTSADEE